MSEWYRISVMSELAMKGDIILNPDYRLFSIQSIVSMLDTVHSNPIAFQASFFCPEYSEAAIYLHGYADGKNTIFDIVKKTCAGPCWSYWRKANHFVLSPTNLNHLKTAYSMPLALP